jgi:hypothetical protein
VTGKNGKIGKGIQSYLDEFFCIRNKERKKDRIQISSVKRNFINVTQLIPIVVAYPPLK